MAIITLKLKKIHKNGMASYKFDSQRTTGTVYFDKKMWAGAEAKRAPQELTIEADGIVIPEPAPVKTPAEPAEDAAAE